MSIQVVKCQTKIKTVIGGVKAIVTGICIRDDSISYEISYFHNGINATAWIKRYEFEVDFQEKKQAGLVNYDKVEENNDTVLLLNTQ